MQKLEWVGCKIINFVPDHLSYIHEKTFHPFGFALR